MFLAEQGEEENNHHSARESVRQLCGRTLKGRSATAAPMLQACLYKNKPRERQGGAASGGSTVRNRRFRQPSGLFAESYRVAPELALGLPQGESARPTTFGKNLFPSMNSLGHERGSVKSTPGTATRGVRPSSPR